MLHPHQLNLGTGLRTLTLSKCRRGGISIHWAVIFPGGCLLFHHWNEVERDILELKLRHSLEKEAGDVSQMLHFPECCKLAITSTALLPRVASLAVA